MTLAQLLWSCNATDASLYYLRESWHVSPYDVVETSREDFSADFRKISPAKFIFFQLRNYRYEAALFAPDSSPDCNDLKFPPISYSNYDFAVPRKIVDWKSKHTEP